MSGKLHVIVLKSGVMTTSPVTHDETRKNWACVLVDPDPDQPGGYTRSWLKKARGAGLTYIIDASVKAGDCLMFCADFFADDGEKNFVRANCVVESITTSIITLQEHDNKDDAWQIGQEMKKNRNATDSEKENNIKILEMFSSEQLTAEIARREDVPVEQPRPQAPTAHDDSDIPF